MTIYLVLLPILLFTIFLISKAFVKNLYLLFYLIFRSKFWAIQLTTLILLPGTIVHELSHLVVAEILRVPTGEISFVPKIEDEKIKAGSLKIAQVDPFRRTLVGLAPLLAGLTIISLISKFYFINRPPSAISYTLLALCYLLFAISNTMFSSKKDLEAAILPAIILFMIIGAFYLGGFSINTKPETQQTAKNILMSINSALGLTIFIDLVFLGIVKILFALSRKIFKQRLITIE